MATQDRTGETDGELLDGLTEIASQAAAAILAVRDPAASQRRKPDNSVVTEADEAAEATVLAGLARLMPDVPIVSEESVSDAPRTLGRRFMMIDPLDGTRELLAGEVEYAVNIAVVEDGTPVLGVIAAPAMGLVWRGAAGIGAERMALAPGATLREARDRSPIRVRARPAGRAVAAVSRFHRDAETDAFIRRFGEVECVTVGSAIKFCRVAEGRIDIYARLSPMSEWDIAAGHAIVTAAGGSMTGPDGKPLPYGRPGFRVRGFVALGGAPQA
jgi:3'(2'), 5'-bisphosphate nucleotidase